MEELAAYLPLDRRRALVEGVTLREWTEGVVLFADISGFSQLTTEFLQAMGTRRGSEALTHELNRVYTAVIDEVHRYEGSVLNFSGDAIMCWFDQDDGVRALTSAQAIQQKMSKMPPIATPSGTLIEVAIKVALSSGRVRRFLVGQPEHGVIEVMAGRVLDRMALAEKVAQPGEVIVDDVLESRLQAVLTIDARRTNQGFQFGRVKRFEPSAPLEYESTHVVPESEASRPWLLPPVFTRLQQGQGEFLTELRQATALFMRFGVQNYDEDLEAKERLNRFFCRVQTIVSRYEGYILQLTTGDKGSYLYCVFGAPIAHEDDPVRAVGAALELQTLSAEFPFIGQPQIGISHGLARTGAYGSPRRRTYGVLGNEVNVSAQLMGRAQPGQILTTDAVVNATGSAFQFDTLAPIQVKGRRTPLPIYAVHSRLAESALQIAAYQLVGRTVELEKIEAKVNALVAGKSHTIIIEGEAGIGKSYLLGAATSFVDHDHILCLQGDASAIEQSSAYYAWRHVFGRLFDIDASEERSREQMRADLLVKLAQFVPNKVPYAPLLSVVLPFDLPDNDVTKQLEGEVRANNVSELFVGILKAVAKTCPLFIILEDAHWLDSASWGLVRLLQREVAPLLQLLVTRPNGRVVPPVYKHLCEQASTEVLLLDSLRSADIGRMLNQRLGVDTLPQAVLDLVAKQANGHPFFSQEIVLALRDTGVIEIEGRHCRLTQTVERLADLEVPDTVEGVIISRIDQLSPRQQLMLKVASVIGRLFAFKTLRDVHPVERDDARLMRHLKQVERLDITELETEEPDFIYQFKHIITQEVIYNLNSFANRRALHHEVAKWYEETYGDDLSPHYSRLVYHWSRAEQPRMTVDYLEKAGKRALDNNASQEAVRFFSRAIELAEKAGVSRQSLRYVNWLRYLGRAHYLLGHMAECQQHCAEALAILDKPLPMTGRAQTVALLSAVATQVRHRLFGGRLMRAVVGPERERLTIALQIMMILIDLFFIQEESNQFLYATLTTLNWAEQAAHYESQPSGYAVVGLIAGILRGRWAWYYIDRAVLVAERINAPAALGIAYSRRGVHRVLTDEIQAARQDYKRAIMHFQRINDLRGIGDCYNFLMRSLWSEGQLDESLHYIDLLLEQGRKSDNKQHVGWGFVYKGMCYLQLEAYEQAEVCISNALETFGEHISPVEVMETKAMLAVIHSVREEFEQALALADEVQGMLRDSSPVTAGKGGVYAWVIMGYRNCLTQAQNSAERQSILKKIETVLKSLRSFARFYPSASLQYYWLYGYYQWEANRPKQAYESWRRVIKSYVNSERVMTLGVTHYALGRYLPDSDPDRPMHRQRAVELLQLTQSTPDIQRAEQLLAEPG